MRYRKIPDETIRRLPVYLRGVLHLSEQGMESVSSRKLGGLVGVPPWLIRKDFSYFGDFGTPGIGYGIKTLIKQISKILRLDVMHEAAVVGVGNVGSALLSYSGFGIYGFRISAAFDVDKRKVGKVRSGVKIEDVSTLRGVKKRGIRLGIIAVPAAVAQQVADEMVEAGIIGILNFSPRYITVPKKVKVITIDIGMDLARLPYYLPCG